MKKRQPNNQNKYKDYQIRVNREIKKSKNTYYSKFFDEHQYQKLQIMVTLINVYKLFNILFYLRNSLFNKFYNSCFTRDILHKRNTTVFHGHPI